MQILVDETELDAIRGAARRHGMTVSEWVRQAMRSARREDATGDVSRKLAVIRAAVKYDAPTGDIDQMLAQIEQGYLRPSK